MKNVVNRSLIGNPGNLLMLAQCLKRDFEKFLQREDSDSRFDENRAAEETSTDISIVHLLEEHFSTLAHSR